MAKSYPEEMKLLAETLEIPPKDIKDSGIVDFNLTSVFKRLEIDMVGLDNYCKGKGMEEEKESIQDFLTRTIGKEKTATFVNYFLEDNR